MTENMTKDKNLPWGARFEKAWQCPGHKLVLKIKLKQTEKTALKTAFFVLDPQNSSSPLSVIFEKPENATPDGVLSSQLRRHFPSGNIDGVYKVRLNESQKAFSKDIWIQMNHQGEIYWLHIFMGVPREIRFLIPYSADPEAPQTPHIRSRMGSQGSFTNLIPCHKAENIKDGCPPHTSRLSENLLTQYLNISQEPQESPLPTSSRTLSRIFKRISSLENTLKKLQNSLPSRETLNLTQHQATLLQTYLFQVQPGDQELCLPDENPIPLDPKKSPSENLNERFEKVSKLKRTHKAVQERIEMTQEMIREMEAFAAEIENEESSSPEAVQQKLHQYARRWGLPKDQQKPASQSHTQTRTHIPTQPHMTYLSSSGPPIFVGRNALSNDNLTRTARSNDLWLHAVGCPGSHVVVPLRNKTQQSWNSQEQPLKDILREAAILALHHSSRRKDHKGEVDLCRRRDLKKPKKAPPGLWHLVRSQTLYVQYDEEELLVLRLEG